MDSTKVFRAFVIDDNAAESEQKVFANLKEQSEFTLTSDWLLEKKSLPSNCEVQFSR